MFEKVHVLAEFGKNKIKSESKIKYSKFYPKRIIQIDRLELSTEISHIKSYPGELSKNFFIQI